ncbi:MAG: molybdopterin-dependent oxidoreductase, partial [Phycisphaerales bacterium]|nr:molybdopterin-dependent oxidoreductase [Phycisphaerales bacterium]
CYHDALSRPAQCRICLGEIWAPNPRNENKLEPQAGGKLQPTCTTMAGDGMVVYTDSPKAVANQKAVMEYLLINHPLDCPVCDQSGECFLQDYSYEYGRGVSRFQEQKVKQAKKDLGPHVWLYADRCIMCTRCVRFDREVAGAGELMIGGRGNRSEIDVFPGRALQNELSGNVVDLCPVGALLDKDFLFAQRVWFLKKTASIDGITASGDNISVEHNEGKVYRVKPRQNDAINKHWITDEVRYGWKFVHNSERLTEPKARRYGALVEAEWPRAYRAALDGLQSAVDAGKRVALLVSPMLSCEEAFALATLAKAIDDDAILAVGPVPMKGEDKAFPPTKSVDDPEAFVMVAEKAPNARGVRRVLKSVAGSDPVEFHDFLDAIGDAGALVLTGNYPTDWVPQELADAASDRFTVLIDTLPSRLIDASDVLLPGATWVEKAGTFENHRNVLQAFDSAIPPIARTEGQIAHDLLAALGVEAYVSAMPETKNRRPDVVVVDDGPGQVPQATEVELPRGLLFVAADVRERMAGAGLGEFTAEVSIPPKAEKKTGDLRVVEL